MSTTVLTVAVNAVVVTGIADKSVPKAIPPTSARRRKMFVAGTAVAALTLAPIALFMVTAKSETICGIVCGFKLP